MRPRGIIIMGVSGAGKSTLGEALAHCHGYAFIEGDTLHSAESVAKMAAGVPLDDDDRWPWLERIASALEHAMREGGGIVACSALRRRYRDFLRDRLPSDLAFVHPVLDRPLLRQRLEQRQGHYMAPTLLDSQLATLEMPTLDEGVIEVQARQSTAEQLAALEPVLTPRSLDSKPPRT